MSKLSANLGIFSANMTKLSANMASVWNCRLQHSGVSARLVVGGGIFLKIYTPATVYLPTLNVQCTQFSKYGYKSTTSSFINPYQYSMYMYWTLDNGRESWNGLCNKTVLGGRKQKTRPGKIFKPTKASVSFWCGSTSWNGGFRSGADLISRIFF